MKSNQINEVSLIDIDFFDKREVPYLSVERRGREFETHLRVMVLEQRNSAQATFPDTSLLGAGLSYFMAQELRVSHTCVSKTCFPQM